MGAWRAGSSGRPAVPTDEREAQSSSDGSRCIRCVGSGRWSLPCAACRIRGCGLLSMRRAHWPHCVTSFIYHKP
eukprot:3994989-Prymnesium_polylepis.1